MGSRKKKNEKRQQKRKEKHKQERARKAKLLRQRPFEGDMLIVPPGGVEKMSEVLRDFVDPYWEGCKTEEQLRKLITLGIIAWNAGLVTGSERSELIEGPLETLPPDLRPGMRAFLEEMIRRKETAFASNKRMIVDYELTMGPAGPHLSVISTFQDL
jgi:hypothetical protein